jgi:ABC-type uncharacterized transport system fused permease/ATPase subunit
MPNGFNSAQLCQTSLVHFNYAKKKLFMPNLSPFGPLTQKLSNYVLLCLLIKFSQNYLNFFMFFSIMPKLSCFAQFLPKLLTFPQIMPNLSNFTQLMPPLSSFAPLVPHLSNFAQLMPNLSSFA